MRSNVIRINQWQSTRDSAIRQAQAARFQQRQERAPIEAFEWPEAPRISRWEQIIAAAMVFQILWWVVTGKLFRAM